MQSDVSAADNRIGNEVQSPLFIGSSHCCQRLAEPNQRAWAASVLQPDQLRDRSGRRDCGSPVSHRLAATAHVTAVTRTGRSRPLPGRCPPHSGLNPCASERQRWPPHYVYSLTLPLPLSFVRNHIQFRTAFGEQVSSSNNPDFRKACRLCCLIYGVDHPAIRNPN